MCGIPPIASLFAQDSQYVASNGSLIFCIMSQQGSTWFKSALS
uniref:Uncharacterized protein n=1 Tax=Anguilla anguilla TaxID=7936 RepID=A0A0E9WSM4_ANGAN